MFVLTLKSKISKKAGKIILVSIAVAVCALMVLLCTAIVLDTPSDSAVCSTIGEYSTVLIDCNDAKDFALQFDKNIEELYSEKLVYIPVEFDSTYTQYNELQKRQGLDLENFKGRKCMLYIYKLSNFTIDYADTYMSIIVYKDRVIGGHISTGVLDSMLYTFCGE